MDIVATAGKWLLKSTERNLGKNRKQNARNLNNKSKHIFFLFFSIQLPCVIVM